MTSRQSRDAPGAASPRAGLHVRLRRWRSALGLHLLRERFGATVYIDACDLPPEPESPYRARLTLSPERVPPGFELREREVVRGQVRMIFEIHCACGKRWLTPQRESVQLCPRCDRAVLLSDGDDPA